MAERAIIRTKAVVLRNLNYGETSQIVTLLTHEKGKIGVMAKGARRPKSSFGATLQPMAFTEVVFYHKPTRDLQILSESDHVEAFHNLRRDLESITVGLRIVELVDALLEEENPDPEVFSLTVRSLRHLNQTHARVANMWPFMQLRLAEHLGIAPAIDRSNVEAVEEDGLLSRANGGVYPADANPEAPLQASREALRAYAVFARADAETAMRMELSPSVRHEVEVLVRDFLKYHVEEAYPNRSEKVIAQLERSPSQSPDPSASSSSGE